MCVAEKVRWYERVSKAGSVDLERPPTLVGVCQKSLRAAFLGSAAVVKCVALARLGDPLDVALKPMLLLQCKSLCLTSFLFHTFSNRRASFHQPASSVLTAGDNLRRESPDPGCRMLHGSAEGERYVP